MAKRIITLVLVLRCAFGKGSMAEAGHSVIEVHQQTQTGWNGTYSAFQREIEIDVIPRVPEVDRLSIYRLTYAKPIPFYSEAESGFIYQIDEYGQFFSFEQNPPYEFIEEMSKKQKSELVMTDYAFDGFVFDRPYARNNPLTLKDVERLITEKSDRVGLDASNFDLEWPAQLMAYAVCDQAGEQLGNGFMYIDYYQQLSGVPILCHAAVAFENPEMPQYVPSLGCQIAGEDSFYIYFSTLKVEEILAEDVPLCRFSSVIQSLERLITDGRLRKVFDMQLGYVLFTDPNYSGRGENITVDCYYAKPMWVIKGIYVKDPDEPYEADEGIERFGHYAATLLVDAQNGDVIEYRGRADNKRALWNGFITWDGERIQ